MKNYPNIKLYINGIEDTESEIIIFPGGEPHVKLCKDTINASQSSSVGIFSQCSNANDFLATIALTDALQKMFIFDINLLMPYFPGARQDRVEKGTALTAGIYADILNMFEYNCVVLFDPHSNVAPALINRCVANSVEYLFEENKKYFQYLDGIICPDRGAEKRCQEAAKAVGISTILYCGKKRDPKTGALSGFITDPLPGKGNYLIVDDICDGGGTFLGLHEEYKKDPNFKGSNFYLYVSHGIFSQGLEKLTERFEMIYTTNSLPQKKNIKLHVFDI